QMEELQAQIQKMNGVIRDSCTAGQWLADKAGAQGLSALARNKASFIAQGTGAVTDFVGGFFPDGDTPEGVADNTEDGQSAVNKMIYGNIAWKAMKKAGVSGWFSSGDDEFLETLMSVTGTVVIRKGTDANGKP